MRLCHTSIRGRFESSEKALWSEILCVPVKAYHTTRGGENYPLGMGNKLKPGSGPEGMRVVDRTVRHCRSHRTQSFPSAKIIRYLFDRLYEY